MTFDNADQQAEDHDVTPLLTEFGATQDPTTLRAVTDLAAQHLTGWQYWAYCGCDDPTTTGPGTKQALVIDPAKPPRSDNVDRAKLRILAVPHPLRVAGTPTAYSFDRTARTFRLTWTSQRADGSGSFGRAGRTTVAVPRLQYPHGYRVVTDDARVLSAKDSRVLVLRLRPGHDTAEIEVAPRG